MADFAIGPSPLQPGEVALGTVRPSPRLLVGEILQALIVVGVTLAFSAFAAWLGLHPEDQGPPTWGPDAALGPAGLGIGAVGVELIYLVPRIIAAWISVQFTHYILTSDRIYARTEFFSTDLKVIPYEKITLLTLRRGFFARLLGIAEISVGAYGADEGRVRMRGLRDPRPMFDLARERIRVHNTAESIARSD